MATRRAEVLAGDCVSNLLLDIKKAEVMSLAIDLLATELTLKHWMILYLHPGITDK